MKKHAVYRALAAISINVASCLLVPFTIGGCVLNTEPPGPQKPLSGEKDHLVKYTFTVPP